MSERAEREAASRARSQAGWHRTEDTVRAVWCSNCQARPGDPCTQPTDTGRKAVTWLHDARVELMQRVLERPPVDMAAEYDASQRRIRQAQQSLRTETNPAERDRLKRVVEHEMWVWN